MNSQILECGHEPSPHESFTTGYGVDMDGNRKCYECCAVDDKARMIETGKATLYLSRSISAEWPDKGKEVWTVGNWPGSLKLRTGSPRKGRHNIAGSRYDVWFTGPDGKDWHGVQYGENTQICHCRRRIS